MKKALIIQGGWQGHEPKQVSDIMAAGLRENGVEVEVVDSLDVLKERDLKALDLIVMQWTMGKIERDQLTPLLEAVESGVGIAGLHGGMGDAFREATPYQFMVGGQWVAHPGNDGIDYDVYIVDKGHWITQGVSGFHAKSEHYYMHIDPAIHVLAATPFGDVAMPVAWTKMWGKGRVFYSSMGHLASVFDQDPNIAKLQTRGMLWAAHALEGTD
ncbi:MAG: ThuA domain-containing protein [Anaerolineae bacterium]